MAEETNMEALREHYANKKNDEDRPHTPDKLRPWWRWDDDNPDVVAHRDDGHRIEQTPCRTESRMGNGWQAFPKSHDWWWIYDVDHDDALAEYDKDFPLLIDEVEYKLQEMAFGVDELVEVHMNKAVSAGTPTQEPPTKEGDYLFFGVRHLDYFTDNSFQLVRVRRDGVGNLMFCGSEFMYNPEEYTGLWVRLDFNELKRQGVELLTYKATQKAVRDKASWQTLEDYLPRSKYRSKLNESMLAIALENGWIDEKGR